MSKKPADTFTVTQASLALGVSTKRVRQLINEGKLEAYSTNPTTLKQVEVIELKIEREKQGSARATNPKQSNTIASAELLAQISELISQSTETNRRAIELVQESAQRNETNLIARVNELQAELDRLRARRNWWRK
jgi:Asp-tRNA(Asn)/Glu-tRNA(Gln) amidotransferase B subunit